MTQASRRVLVTWGVVVLVLVVGAVVAWRVRRERLSGALVDSVLVAANTPPPRPVIIEPALDGGSAKTCATALQAAQPKLTWFSPSPPDAGATVSSVLRGDSPAAALPAAAWDELDANLAWAERLADCARLTEPRLAEQYLATEPKGFSANAPHKFLSLDGVRALDGGVGVALHRCAQVLSLGAEASRGALVGAMIGAFVVNDSARWCAQAIRAAEVADVERFEGRLLRAREAFRPLSEALRTERDLLMLSLFWSSLPAAQHDRLPARLAGDLADWGLVFDQPLLAQWLLELGWVEVRDRFDAQIAAAQLPPPKQAAAFAALSSSRSWVQQLPLLSVLDLDYARFAERRAKADEVLEQLIALTQARLGKAYEGPSQTLTVDGGVVRSALPGVAPLKLSEAPLDAGPP